MEFLPYVQATQPEGWGELPCDLIKQIVTDHLPCGIDRLRLSWINQHWGKSIREMKLPELPWLFLPSSSTPRFFDPASRCLHNIWLPAELKSGLLCGALGPWVFISIEDPEPQFILYNLCNGERRGRIDLPLTILDRDGTTQEAWVQMAALTRPPSTGRYTVAAVLYIGESRDATIATWKLEDKHWTEIGSTSDWVVDILFYQGEFHFLTSNEDLLRLVPLPQGTYFRMLRYQVVRSSKPLDDRYQDRVGNVIRRYLVESTAGHLLLAVKKTHRTSKTFDIGVYRLSVDDEAGQATWAHYKNPAGEMLFLGQASSVSCVTRFDPTIHFLDDRMEESEDELGHYFRRDDMGGLQPHVLQVSFRTPDEETAFSYRAPNDIGVTDLPTPVWCEPQSGDSTK